MEKMFDVDPKVYACSDPRIVSLQKGELSQIDFIHLLKTTDPFGIRGGKLILLTPKIVDVERSLHIKRFGERLKIFAGIPLGMVFDHKDKVLAAFPELTETYANVEREIDAEKCFGCRRNSKGKIIIEGMMSLASPDRDLSSMVGTFPPYSIDILHGMKVGLDDIDPGDIPAMRQFRKDPLLYREDVDRMLLVQNPLGIVRENCFDCVRKHLPQAIILLRECLQGYSPNDGHMHQDFALAHIRQAIDESIKGDYGLAKRIELHLVTFNESNDIPLLIDGLMSALKDASDVINSDVGSDRLIALAYISQGCDMLAGTYPDECNRIRDIRTGMMR